MTERNEGRFRAFIRDENVRKGVLVSLVSSLLFLLLLQPVLTFLGKAIIWVGSRAWVGALDSVYASAALGHRNDVAVMLLGIVLVPIIAVSSASVLFMILPRKPLDGIAKTRPSKLVTALGSGFLMLITLLLLASSFLDLQLTTSFDQRLTVLAPHLEVIEEKRLRASWASMTTRVQYLSINARLDSIAASKGVSLPRPLF